MSSEPATSTTHTLTSSSVYSDGTPIAAHSATSGCWMHERLDLERRDVLAAAADGVLDAVDEVVVAVGVARNASPVWNQPLRHASAVASGMA